MKIELEIEIVKTENGILIELPIDFFKTTSGNTILLLSNEKVKIKDNKKGGL